MNMFKLNDQDARPYRAEPPEEVPEHPAPEPPERSGEPGQEPPGRAPRGRRRAEHGGGDSLGREGAGEADPDLRW